MFKYQGLIIFLYTASSIASIPKIQVKIATGLKEVKVKGTDINNRIELTRSSKVYTGNNTLNFKCNPILDKISLDKPAIHLASLQSKVGVLSWNKAGYTGKLNVVLSKNGNGCDLVNEISLEKYISLLLTKEMNHKWPLEALKAQAVAARSYAYHKMLTGQVSKDKGYKAFYDLENSEKHQVNGTFFDQRKSTIKAAKETHGKILTLSDGQSTPIFFHSKCGGHTLAPHQVWRNKIAGYESVKCNYCQNHGVKNWRVDITPKELLKLMDKTLRDFHSQRLVASNKFVKIVPDKNRNSVLRVYDEGQLKSMKKSRLRSKLGYKKALSNNFKISKDKKGIFFQGKGHGHGVGLCQFGALEMARRGFNYKQILNHYFPNHSLRRVY